MATPLVVGQIMQALPPHPDDAAGAGASSEASDSKLGAGSGGSDRLMLLPLQVLIVGAKFDKAVAPRDKEDDASRKRAQVLAQALRALAHLHGASLVTTSTKDKASLGAFRNFLAAAAFGSEPRRGALTDPARPLAVPAGADSFEAIGAPVSIPVQPGVPTATPLSGATLTPAEAKLDRYFEAVRQLWGARESDEDTDLVVAGAAAAAAIGGGAAATPAGAAGGLFVGNPSSVVPAPASYQPGVPVVFADEAAILHPEPAIDTLRASKAEDLGRMVKEMERKLREEAKMQRQGA
jgi:hypothetical protein